ncbi:MAG: DNA double-strand break repair nuclease NurA [Candidatus Diapherotrites archaeon]
MGKSMFSNVINEAVNAIHSGEELKQNAAKHLFPLKTGDLSKFNSRELLEEKLVFPVAPCSLDCRISGVDSGFVGKNLASLDLVLVRAVSVAFDFENGKMVKALYWPDFYHFPEPVLSNGALDHDEAGCSKSLVRLHKEIFAAKKAIETFSPKYCFLDGSIIPQYADKPRNDSSVCSDYHSIIDEFQSLYALAEESNCTLIACVEDSRGSRFRGILQEEILSKARLFDPKKLDSLFDSSLLDYLLLKGERSCAFTYTKNISQHPILNDFEEKWSRKVHAFYLKPSLYDRPLRVEFLSNGESVSAKANELSSVVFSLSSLHREYAYPSVLIEADLRARLHPNEIEAVYNKIWDKLGKHVKIRLRRENRPF